MGLAAGIALAVVFLVVALIAIVIGTVITKRNKRREERQWNLDPSAVIPPVTAHTPQPPLLPNSDGRPESKHSSGTGGTAYTMAELKFPMKPAKMAEDGRLILLQVEIRLP